MNQYSEMYVCKQQLKRKTIGLKQLEDFIKSTQKMDALFRKYHKHPEHLKFIIWLNRIFCEELKKPYRKEFYLRHCRVQLKLLQQTTAELNQHWGNVSPLLLPAQYFG